MGRRRHVGAAGLCLFALGACAAPLPAPPPIVRARTSVATGSATPVEPSLGIEGEGLAPVRDIAFARAGATLFVQREDRSVEAWDVSRAVQLARAPAGALLTGPLADAPFGSEVAPAAPERVVVLPPLDGVDDARLVTWLASLRVVVERRDASLVLSPPEGLELLVSPDARVVVALEGWRARVAHRVAHAHFDVTGWNEGYSSRFGYDGDHTTWPGTVTASFGPLPDQLALVSTAQRSRYFAYASTRLYDPRTGRLVAALPDETCQPNALAWSPGGTLMARNECEGGSILLSDTASGRALAPIAGRPPFRFASEDVMAAALGFGARVTRISDGRSLVAIPGPPIFRAVSVARDDTRFAILSDDGLDVWDPSKPPYVRHVEDADLTSAELRRSASGRFVSYEREPGKRALVDLASATREILPSRVAFDPSHDAIAIAGERGLVVRDLASARESDPIALDGTRSSKLGVAALAYTPDGAFVVALLSDASLRFLDATGHAAGSTGPVDRAGCPTSELHFPKAGVVRIGCATATYARSVPKGEPVADAPSDEPTPPVAPPFSPPIVEALIAKTQRPVGLGTDLLLAALDPPLLVRRSDRRLVSLHAFAVGAGRAVVVLDESGHWDANELGATLVHVTRAGIDDDAEKTRRRVPGLLTRFVRGDSIVDRP